MTNDVLVKRLHDATGAAMPFAANAVDELRTRLGHTIERSCIPDRPFDIAFRIKTLEAIQHKLVRRGPLLADGLRINDFIGIRILTLHSGCLLGAEKAVTEWARETGLRLVLRHDTIDRLDTSGYRSKHLDFQFEDPSQYLLPVEASVEIQLETWLQHVHAMLSHRYHYKKRPVDPNLGSALSDLSVQLDAADRDIARVERIIKQFHDSD